MQTVYSPPPKSIVHKVISLTPKAEKILLRPPRLIGRRTSANSSWITKELTQRRSSEVIVPTSPTKKTSAAGGNDDDNVSKNHQDDEKKIRPKKTTPRRRHSSFVPTKTSSSSSSSSSSPTKTKKAVVVANPTGVDKDEARDKNDMKIKKKLERKTSTSSSTSSPSKPPRRRRSSKRNPSSSASSITQHSSFSTQATQRTSSTAPTTTTTTRTTTSGGSFSLTAGTNNNPDAEASISAPDRFWSSSSFNNSFDMSLSFEFPDMEFEYDGELNDVVAKSNHGSRSVDNNLLEEDHEHGGDDDDFHSGMYRTITQDELRSLQRKNKDPSKSCGEGVIVHIFDNNSGTNTNISTAIDEHLEHLSMIYSASCKFVRINASSCSPTYLQRKLGITSQSSLPAVIALRNGVIEAQLSDIIPNLHDTLTQQDLKDGHFLSEFITISGFNKSQSCNNRRSLMDSFRFASFTNRG